MFRNKKDRRGRICGEVLCFGGGRYCINKKSPKVPKWLSSVLLSDLIGMTCRGSARVFNEHTRKELKKDSKTLAKALLALGIKKGDYVVVLDNFYPCVCMIYAAMRIGAIAVPFAEDATDDMLVKFIMERKSDVFLVVNDKDKKYATKICKQTAYKCKRVISINSNRPRIVNQQPIKLDQEYYDYLDMPAVARLGKKKLHIPWSSGDTVLLGSSSGSSGEAKFFPYTDYNIISSVLSAQVAFNVSLFSRNKDTWAGIVPRQRPYGLLNSALIPSWGRRRVYLAHQDDTVDEIFTEAQVVCCAPDFADIVLEQLTINGYDITKNNKAKPITLIFGGAFLPIDKSEILRSFLNQRGFDATLCVGYGISEAAGCISVVTEEEYRPDTVGKLVPGVKVWLRKDDGSAYKLGDIGRLWVAGNTVVQTYDDETINAKNICYDDNGEVWVDTGDYMSLQPSGHLIFHYSEKDFYFAETHEKIYPRKAEDAIKQIDGVARCWVLGDQERSASIAFIAPKPGVDAKKLREYIIQNIAKAQTKQNEFLSELEIPRYYQMVKTSDLKEDRSGKRLKTTKEQLLNLIDFDNPEKI